MIGIPRRLAPLFAAALLVGAAAPPPGAGPSGPAHRLDDEIARWSDYVDKAKAEDDLWGQVREGAAPALERARTALADGRRLLALQRLAAARANVAAYAWVAEHPAAARKDDAAFEAEWARLGKTLGAALRPPSKGALAGVRPAVLRALGEASLIQVKVFYNASLEYGRNTMAEEGLFYLGSAVAQRDFAEFCRSASGPVAGAPPPVRALSEEIEALEHDMLALYRPPLSIDRHRDFILAHAALKEARELDALGLRYGALLRYLDAALRTVPLRADTPSTFDAAAIAARLDESRRRLDDRTNDHTIGRLYLEAAESDLAAPAAAGPAVAFAITSDVLPRYFAALAPPRPAPARPAPSVTVTLVRWPYT